MCQCDKFINALKREAQSDLLAQLKKVKLKDEDVNYLVEHEIDQVGRFLFDLYKKAYRTTGT